MEEVGRHVCVIAVVRMLDVVILGGTPEGYQLLNIISDDLGSNFSWNIEKNITKGKLRLAIAAAKRVARLSFPGFTRAEVCATVMLVMLVMLVRTSKLDFKLL